MRAILLPEKSNTQWVTGIKYFLSSHSGSEGKDRAVEKRDTDYVRQRGLKINLSVGRICVVNLAFHPGRGKKVKCKKKWGCHGNSESEYGSVFIESDILINCNLPRASNQASIKFSLPLSLSLSDLALISPGLLFHVFASSLRMRV